MPPSPDLLASLQQWLALADGDVAAAGLLAAHPAHYRRTAFYCQQAVEKLLKARLSSLGHEPPRTHDLQRLLNLLPPTDAVTLTEETYAATLTPFAVVARYPQDDDPDELPVQALLAMATHFLSRWRPLILLAAPAV